MAEQKNCETCGACCASFCVDFHPAEQEGGAFAWGKGVPLAFCLSVNSRIARMKGTDATPARCIALTGEIGTSVACQIYAERPSPCREFLPEHAACDHARRQQGLVSSLSPYVFKR